MYLHHAGGRLQSADMTPREAPAPRAIAQEDFIDRPPHVSSIESAPSQRMSSVTVEVEPSLTLHVAGVSDENLRVIEDSLDVDVLMRGSSITIRGQASEVSHARKTLQEMLIMARRGLVLNAETTRRTIGMVQEAEVVSLAAITTTAPPIVNYRGKAIRPKTPGQREYVDAIDNNTVVLAIGPAGTGKTYLAMAKAIQALNNHGVQRIILTRPAVEAGEKLGYLPGTLGDKIDPYLRPLHDALRDMVDPETIPRLIETGVIEVAPLAYMRGRTLSGSFVILDEAQNTTPAQMKMFLTRLGFGSKMVVTGDLTQVDLPGHQESGLNVAQKILGNVDGVHIARLHQDNVVRHHVVERIVTAYDCYEAEQEGKR